MAENPTLFGTLFSAGRYQPGQGKFVRASITASCILLLVFGAVQLNQVLASLATSVWICNAHPDVQQAESGPCPYGDRSSLIERKRDSWYGQRVYHTTVLGVEITLYNATYVAVGAFVLLSWVVWRVFHWKRSADFLIETEGELRKVAWPPRREFLGASLVVIILTVFFSGFLFAVDQGLSWLMQRLQIGI